MTATPQVDCIASVVQKHPAADQATGAIVAQQAIDGIRSGSPVDFAWLRWCELVAVHGWRSAACRAFVAELAKRAASA